MLRVVHSTRDTDRANTQQQLAKKRNIFEEVAQHWQDDERSAFSGNPVSKNYRNLTTATDRKVVGRWPQVSDINTFIAHEIKFHEFPWFTIRFDRIELQRSARLTDCLSTAAISAHAFILSTKALNVFHRFDLGKHAIYPATVHHKESINEYHVLHIINDMEGLLDCSRSRFHVSDMLGKPRFGIQITDLEELRAKREQVKKGELPGTEEFDYVRLTYGHFIADAGLPDIFSIRCAGVDPFITSTLAAAIHEAGLTGFQITPTLELADPVP